MIVAFAAAMNRGLSDQLKEAFPDVIPEPRPMVTDQQTLDPNWLAGFTSGEGCFFIEIYKSPPRAKLDKSVKLEFNLTQHVSDQQLMSKLIKFLGCGSIYLKRNIVQYRTSKLSDLTNKIIPFFKKYNIIGVKSKNFEDWCRVAELMKENKHLTLEGLEQIRKIKTSMNRGRVN